MFRAFMALTALFLLILGASEASAQNFPVYRVVAQGTGKILPLSQSASAQRSLREIAERRVSGIFSARTATDL